MKKYCKHIDITNRNFIAIAVRECLQDKMGRSDTLRLFQEYSGLPISLLKKIVKDKEYWMLDGIIETIIDAIQQEIIYDRISFKEIHYMYRREGKKIRRIGIQDIKQQIYDYIAVNGLKEMLLKRIGYYQCAAIPKKGQLMGAKAIKRWLRNKAFKYAWKGDIKHYYENVDRKVLMRLLRRCVDNELLLCLVYKLIYTFEKGLSIGSYLSQYLANFFLSFVYHYANENLFKIRKCKNGKFKTVKLAYKVLFFMDDILIIGKALKDIKTARNMIAEYLNNILKLRLKETEKFLNLQVNYIDMMGYKISRKNLTVRSSIFIKFRKTIVKFRKRKLTLDLAQSIISRFGWLKTSDCKHYVKKHKIKIIFKKAKEMVSNENKNGIRRTAIKCKYC